MGAVVLRWLILGLLLATGGVLVSAPRFAGMSEGFAHWWQPTAAVPGRFTEILAPQLTPDLPRSTDYAPLEGVFVQHAFAFGREERVWHGLAPKAGDASPTAVVMLLHGSGRDGRAMLDMWQGVARAAGVLLIAPDA